MSENVLALGAGLSSLGLARALDGVQIYEATARAGGHAHSHLSDGVYFDEGAHICHSRDKKFLNLIFSQSGPVAHVSPSKVANYRDGHWFSYPVQNHLHELPVETRTAAMIDFVMAQIQRSHTPPKNYLEWCLANYGKYLTDNYYAEYTAKYWRVPMEDLSTDWLSGRLLPSDIARILAGSYRATEEDQAAFSLFHYPEDGGFFGFFKPLFAPLDIRYNAKAVLIEPTTKIVHFADGAQVYYEALASSIPLPELVSIVKDVPASVRASAALLRHTKLLCVNLVVRRVRLSPWHWFYIYDSDIEASRVSLVTNLSSRIVADELTGLQAEIFRHQTDEFEVEALIERTVEDLARLLGFDPKTELISVTSVEVPYAYVISDLNRAGVVDHLIPWFEDRDIFPMGLYGRWKYVWSDAAVRSGETCAEQIRNRFCLREETALPESASKPQIE